MLLFYLARICHVPALSSSLSCVSNREREREYNYYESSADAEVAPRHPATPTCGYLQCFCALQDTAAVHNVPNAVCAGACNTSHLPLPLQQLHRKDCTRCDNAAGPVLGILQ